MRLQRAPVRCFSQALPEQVGIEQALDLVGQGDRVACTKEQGFDLVAKPWYALFAPAGTPPAAIERLSKAAMAAVADPATAKRLADMGLEPTGWPAERLAAVLKADYEHWGPVIKASGFKPE